MLNVKDRVWAAGIHFAISATVAALAAALVFGLWYPFPYREVSGGRELFILLTVVDLVLGPALTFAVFSRAKARHLMLLDFSVIGALQLAALAYGIWTVCVARPVHLVFEVDRFTVVHAIDVVPGDIDKLPADQRSLPLAGPTIVAQRAWKPGNETLEATSAALAGVNLAAKPDLWEPYPSARERVLARAKPLALLQERFKAQRSVIDEAVKDSGRASDQLLWLPMTSRSLFWTVLLDRQSAQVVGYLPLDSF